MMKVTNNQILILILILILKLKLILNLILDFKVYENDQFIDYNDGTNDIIFKHFFKKILDKS